MNKNIFNNESTSAEQKAAPQGAMKRAVLYALCLLAVQAVVGCSVRAVTWLAGCDTQQNITMEIITLVLSNLLVMALFIWKKWTLVSPNWMLTRPWMTLSWTAVATLGMLIPFSWLTEHMPELPNLIEATLDRVLSNYWGYVAIGILAPLAEEIVFRGAILRTLLTRFRPWTAIAISALIFSIIHLNPAQMPYAFVAGMLLGWLYWRTGSIVPGIVYHWINNSLAYIVYRLYGSSDPSLTDIFGSERQALIAVGCSLLILLPALYQLHVWMKPAKK